MLSKTKLKEIEKELFKKTKEPETLSEMEDYIYVHSIDFLTVFEVAAGKNKETGEIICDYRLCNYDNDKDEFVKYENKRFNTFEEISAFHLETGLTLFLLYNAIWHNKKLYYQDENGNEFVKELT